MRIFKHPLWSRFVAIARPFFASEARAKAIAGLVILAVLLLAVNGLNFLNSYVMRDFMTALQQKDAHRFYMFGLALGSVFALASLGEAIQFYTEQRMGLLWRDWLTRQLVDRFLAHHAYHRLTVNQAIDNPDQRISEDAKTFTTSSLSFIVLLLNSVLTLSLFLGVLWSITPWLVLAAVVYSAAGSLGTILLGRRLVPLNNRQLQKEADFRFALVRVRERGESDGREQTKNRLLDRFNKVLANFREIIAVTRNVGVFTREYNYLIQILPALLVAPLFFHERAQFGVIAQSAMAFGQVVGAFSLIVTKFQEVSQYAAVVNRLGSMWEATQSTGVPAAAKETAQETDSPHIEMAVDNEQVAFENLTLWTPRDKLVLMRDVSVEVPQGQRLLVTGPSNSGKSALSLALAGLWGEGRGKIRAPDKEHAMFLPQRLYTATGRLRDLLLAGHNGEAIDDDQLRAALRDVGLDYLAENAEGLDSEWDWPNDLSPGDKHALALARVLLARPRFVFLDGVPWGLSESRLQRLYAALARTPTSYISLGADAGLLPYHDLWLELRGEGKWQLRQTHNGDQTLQSEERETQHDEALR